MSRILIVFVLLCAGLSILTLGSYASPNDEHQGANDSSVQQVNPVVQWNRTLLAIVRTPGAQPATVHPTRSFAILHAAIYDAVNAIDRTHRPYLVRLSGVPRDASQEAAAAAAAHEVLVALYPAFQVAFDTALQQFLAQITTARMPSRFLMFSGRLRETTNRRLRIFRPSRNSLIGLAWPRSRWSVRASSGPALPRRWPAIRTVMLSIKSNPSGS